MAEVGEGSIHPSGRSWRSTPLGHNRIYNRTAAGGGCWSVFGVVSYDWGCWIRSCEMAQWLYQVAWESACGWSPSPLRGLFGSRWNVGMFHITCRQWEGGRYVLVSKREREREGAMNKSEGTFAQLTGRMREHGKTKQMSAQWHLIRGTRSKKVAKSTEWNSAQLTVVDVNY